MIYILIIAFFACMFISCVIENETMPKEEKYRWFAAFVSLTIYTFLIGVIK